MYTDWDLRPELTGGPDLVVRVSRRAVVMYSDMRFSISATRIHARPWKAHSPLLAALKGAQAHTIGSGPFVALLPSPHGWGKDQKVGSPPVSRAGSSGPGPLQATHLGSGCADVLHVFDAAHAVVGHFAAGQPDIVPEAPLTI